MTDTVLDYAIQPRTAALLMLLLLGACGGRGEELLVVPLGTPTAAALASGPGVSEPGSAIQSRSSSSVASMTSTLQEQIGALERSGAVWPLDRSRDIEGPDVNGNGVRDDVEAWVDSRPVSEVQRKALMQTARALQATLLVDLKDEAALDLRGERLMAAVNCGGQQIHPRQALLRFRRKT